MRTKSEVIAIVRKGMSFNTNEHSDPETMIVDALIALNLIEVSAPLTDDDALADFFGEANCYEHFCAMLDEDGFAIVKKRRGLDEPKKNPETTLCELLSYEGVGALAQTAVLDGLMSAGLKIVEK